MRVFNLVENKKLLNRVLRNGWKKLNNNTYIGMDIFNAIIERDISSGQNGFVETLPLYNIRDAVQIRSYFFSTDNISIALIMPGNSNFKVKELF